MPTSSGSRSTLASRSVARSLGLPTKLLPHAAALFEGIDSLGSSPTTVVRMLRGSGFPGHSRVLDLACGKGGTSVALASKLGCKVQGVDAFAPFVNAARVLARARHVEDRCRFRVGNVRSFRSARALDLVVMLGLFGVERAVPLLRRHTKPGGLYLVDDAVTLGTRGAPNAHVPTLSQSRLLFAMQGDKVLQELIPSRTEIAAQSRSLTNNVRARSRRLAKQHPKLAEPLAEFCERLETSGRLLQGQIRPVLWLVRRAS